MAQPQWITPSGSLGTIPENVFYKIPLQAVADEQDVFFTAIAGELPAGIQITENGSIEGIPQNILNVQGVPIEVSEDVTSKFVIRAYTKKVVNGQNVINRINDRTFTITVTGQDVPEFITPPGLLDRFYDGSLVEIQLNFSDPDPTDTVSVRLLSGKLPPGLTIDKNGLISGIIKPLEPILGFDPLPRDNNFNFSPGSFDHPGELFDQGTPGSAGKNFQFTVEISDGKDSNIRTFEIYVYSKTSMSADTNNITADDGFVTADVVPQRTPVLITPAGSIGTVRSDNYFAYQFEGIDFDGDQFVYELIDSLPPELNLTLDPDTGWLSGYIPDRGSREELFEFSLRLKKTSFPDIASSVKTFSIMIIPSVESSVVWITEPDFGTVSNGVISTLSVAARESQGRELQYRLAPDSIGNLPPGLTLTSLGHLAGRVSFNTFAFDSGATTFDKNSRSRAVLQETTFDSVFEFSINAFLPTVESVSVFRTFRIRVDRQFNEPYQDLYIKAMPPESDRDTLNQLLQNQDIIPVTALYRIDDPNFGIAKSVRYNHAFGLRTTEITEYISAMTKNHYWKNLTLGGIRWAQALDSRGRPLYEAIYSRVIDTMLNQRGASVSREILWPVRINGVRTVVYPSSLINMRDRVFDSVGRLGNLLPAWMTSKQPDGRILGFTPAWVIAYVKPGEGAKIAYNVQEKFGNQLNSVDFKADRYELDRSGSFAWDPAEKAWIPDLVDQGNTVSSTDQHDKYLLYPRVTILG